MKKKKIDGLSLNKKVISDLNAKNLKGGLQNPGQQESIISISISLAVCTRWNGCDLPTIGSGDGSNCISTDGKGWCGGR